MAPDPPTNPAPASRPTPPETTDASTVHLDSRDVVGVPIAADGAWLRGDDLQVPTAETRHVTLSSQLARIEGHRKFLVQGQLGRGGMGTVLLAEDVELRRQLAIKTLRKVDSPLRVERFIEEAQITGQLDHPNIVAVHEIGIAPDGRPFMAMPRVRGETLRDMIEARKKEPVGRISSTELTATLGIFHKICDAIAFAHDHGVIHRDLKPDNVMVGRHGEVLVMDWGLAKPVDAHIVEADTRLVVSSRRESNESELTRQGQISGTPMWMPPEQARGEIHRVDARADIYALGGLLYFMLTYEYLRAGSGMGVLHHAISGHVVPPCKRVPARRIPRELEAIVMKALHRETAHRYGRVQEMVADIEAFQSMLPVSVYRRSLLERLTKWVRRHPATMLVTVCLAIVATAVGLTMAEIARRAAAEAEQREATLRVLAQQGEIGALKRSLGVQLGQRRDQAVDQLINLFRQREAAGEREEQIARSLGEERIRAGIRAFEAMLAAHDEHGDEIPVSGSDYYYLGVLYGAGLDQPERAEALFVQARNLLPKEAAVHMSLGSVRMKLGRVPEALDCYEQAAKLAPDRAIVWIYRGVALRSTNLPESIASLTRAIQLTPDDPLPWVYRGNTKRMAGDLEGALADHNTAIGLDDAHAFAFFNRGLLYRQMERFAEALADLSRGLELDDGLAKSWADRASVHVRMGNADDALADANRAIAIDPAFADGHLYRGYALSMKESYADAFAAFEQARQLDETNPTVWLARGDTRALRGDLKGAAEDYSVMLGLDPSMARGWYGRAAVLTELGRLREALGDISHFVELEPRELDGWLLLGRLQADLEMWREAYNTLQHCVELDGDNVEARALVSQAARRVGEADVAFAQATVAVEADPEFGLAWVNRALAALDLHDLATAEADLTHAIKLSPDMAAIWKNRAHVRRLAGRIDDAIADITEAIRLDPAEAGAHASLADLHLRADDPSAALAPAIRAVDLAPDNPSIRLTLGLVHLRLEHAVEAVQHADVALRLDASYAAAYSLRARARCVSGNFALAAADLRRAVQLAPDSRDTWTLLATVYQELEQPAGAIGAWNEVIRLGADDAGAYSDRGHNHYLLGNGTEAITDTTRAIELAPDNPLHWRRRAVVRAALGETDAAEHDLTTALELDDSMAEAWLARAQIRFDSANVEGAMSDAHRAIELGSQDATAWELRGASRRNLGDLAGAREDFGEAIKRAPTVGDYRLERGLLAARMEDWEAAYADLDLVIRELGSETGQEWRAWVARGMAEARMGRVDAARASFAGALERCPEGIREQLQNVRDQYLSEAEDE